MKVFIIGATGFIGFPVAQALVRAGHIVLGLARTEEKSRLLAAEEIIPVSGDASDPSKWTSLLGDIDVVIEAIGGTPDLKTLSLNIFNAVVEAAQTYRPANAPKLTYIYTSGIWVHGENRKRTVTDTTPITNPVPLVSWRPSFENDIITNPIVNGIVIRPALLYGRSASILAALFQTAHAGKVCWVGAPGGRYALIHADDLAELYVLVTEKAQLVGGKIFDAANDFTESVDDILGKLVEVSGAQGPYEYREPSNHYIPWLRSEVGSEAFEAAITTTCYVRPYLAKALLNWQPRKAGLVDNLEVYYNAWKASEGL
ncbi:NAD(P)-binding protein [Panus rudis PR-1116 ss-1]|nr:NAD(P)-binding protein [Panus rudis PR-1116 ss-1]